MEREIIIKLTEDEYLMLDSLIHTSALFQNDEQGIPRIMSQPGGFDPAVLSSALKKWRKGAGRWLARDINFLKKQSEKYSHPKGKFKGRKSTMARKHNPNKGEVEGGRR